MDHSQRSKHPRSRTGLLKALYITLWAVPVLMALIGIAYAFLVEHLRYGSDAHPPWLTWLGVAILGGVGPSLSWIALRWAAGVAEAYLGTESQLTHRNDELATLRTLALAANQFPDLPQTMAVILEQTMEALDAEAGMIFLQEDSQKGLRLMAHRGLPAERANKETCLEPSDCFRGRSVQYHQMLFARDVSHDDHCASDVCICRGFRSVVCAPLEVKGQLVGLLQLASPHVGHFTKGQSDFLAAATGQISASIETVRLYETVRAFSVDLEQKVNKRTHELESARWALTEKAHQLRRLLYTCYRIQEATQSRIARDMHDGVTQLIIGALYETQAARQALPDAPDRAMESLERAQALLTEMEVEIRRAIYDLHPPVLDTMGLPAALKRLASTYSDTFGFDCQVRIIGRALRLPKAIETTIYRIIQGALQNVASHAQATQAQVGFHFGREQLRVVIEDNGIGFDPQAMMDTPGERLGLLGMRERAEGLGAALTVTSASNKGTRIELSLPAPHYIDRNAPLEVGD
jgi:signal transduction histidine kinase